MERGRGEGAGRLTSSGTNAPELVQVASGGSVMIVGALLILGGRGGEEGGRGGEDDRGHRRRDNLTRVRPKKKGRPRWEGEEERRGEERRRRRMATTPEASNSPCRCLTWRREVAVRGKITGWKWRLLFDRSVIERRRR